MGFIHSFRTSRLRKGRRTRAQAMVEFGLIALLFVLMMFGIIDFGMLLNGWINVSTGSAAGARWAALGNRVDDTTKLGIYSQAKASAIVPGLSTSNITMLVTYTSQTNAYSQTTYCRGNTTPTVQVNGTAVTCASEPGLTPSFNPPDPRSSPAVLPTAGDSVQVTVIADKFEVITPLVRPFFGCAPQSTQPCYVPLTSATTMRFETAQ